MKLKNPFSINTRELYRDLWACMECGMNGTTRGGLELNHIVGRYSSSPINASLLCHECHSHIGHSQKEMKRLFEKNRAYLKRIGYIETDSDRQFIKDYFHAPN